jgi:two-component system CheB/CheR fusion protein
VVGLGGSAGSVKALRTFFEQTPASAGMAYVVVLHLMPSHDSALDQILQRSTRMPVSWVESRTPLEVDHVYLIPPGRQLLMEGAHLRLDGLDRPHGAAPAIDTFLRSLAEAHGERAIAVLLSGQGQDGSRGLASIKACGGVTLVQSPTDAEFDAMPLAAMAAGVADFVLAAADMPQEIQGIWQNARVIELPDPPPDLQVSATRRRDEQRQAQQAYHDVLRLLAERTGHDFRHYKRATVLRRLERRMQVTRQPTLPAYLRHLEAQVEESRLLLQDMLIGVTQFFRDRDSFDVLEHRLFERFNLAPPQDLWRAWSVGCASGEEAYSITMLMIDLAGTARPQATVQVFASDIDERALAHARAGLYPEGIVGDVPAARLRQYFHHEGDSYRVAKQVRDRVTFAAHDLMRDPPFSRMSLIACRNLLIYLDREGQRRALETLHYALLPHGLLFLGGSETVDAAPDLFEVVDKRHRLFRRRPGEPTPVRPTAPADAALATLATQAPDSDARERLLASIHQQLLEEYAPPSAIVDRQVRVVHLSPGIARFVRARPPPGARLLDAVLPALRPALERTLALAIESGRSAETGRVALGDAAVGIAAPLHVNILVRPMRHPSAAPHWLLVVFVPSEADPAAWPARTAPDPSQAPGWRPPTDETSGSQEELRAANEELQSLNEELRSATEELETSREELKSLNEELTTVNHALRHKVEEAAKVNDDLKNLIAASDIATVFVDARMRIQRFTPQAASIFAFLPGDVGRPLLDLTHRLDYPRLDEDAHDAFARLVTFQREVRSTDGRWFLVRILPYRTVENRIDGAVLNFIDVTSRRAAEELLRAGEMRLRVVAETTRDFAIVTLDAEGRITGWNHGAQQVFGYDEAEVRGQPGALLFTDEDRRRGVPEEELRRAREIGRSLDERWHLRKGGALVYCSGVTTLLSSSPGEFTGYAKIARDLTETRRAQEQREALLQTEQSLREQLQEASRQKDEFLAVMSHELKNPLNLIALNADLLQRLPETAGLPSVVRIGRTVRASVDSQAKIIDDLLDLSRIQTGKMSLTRHLTRFDAVVAHIVQAVREDAAVKSLALSLEVAEGDHTVYADPIRLEQIVWNLISNALKFTPSGGRVRVGLHTADAETVLEVADTGRGIEPAFLGQVFDMFSQAESGAARREGGLGIGLAVTRRLVELHGGRLEAESSGPGQGATFRVRLPSTATLSAAPAVPVPASLPLAGLRVLMVDDEPDTLETFAALLRFEGATVSLASDAARALEMAQAQPFDLLVSDLAMPGMDGYALIAAVRAQGLDLPAIAVSGMGRASDRQRALAAGFADMASKPVDIETLLALIDRLRPR